MIAVSFDNPVSLHEKMCHRLMWGNRYGVDWDWVYGTEVGIHDTMLRAKSFEWEYDLSRLWLARSRWNLMVRQYLNPAAVEDWLDKIDDRLHRKGRGIAVLRTQMVQGRGTGRGVRRRWGSCMLSISFRTNPWPQITMHSRTTYFGYLAAMDMTVAHALAREAGAIVNIDPAEMQFVWTIELAQFHGFRSLAWPLSEPAMKSAMDSDLLKRQNYPGTHKAALMAPAIDPDLPGPGYRKALDGYWRIKKSDFEGKLYGDEAFSSFARVRRRFHTEVEGSEYADQFAGGSRNHGGKAAFPKLPQLMASTLDLKPLFAPRP